MKTKIAQIACMLALLAIVATAFAHAFDQQMQTQHCADIQAAYLQGAYDTIDEHEPISPKMTRMYAGMLRACNKQ